MRLLALVILVGLPILELYVIVRVGEVIGPLWTVAALFCTSLIGARLVRGQGRAVSRHFVAAIAARRAPAREALDGTLVFVGGALLILPGFVTDILGALLLAPPIRALILRHCAGRLVAHLTRTRGVHPGPGHVRGASRVYDVDGRAIEIDGDELPR